MTNNKHMDYLENIKSQIRKGLLEFAILLIIEEGEVYANDILKQLSKTDLIIVEGTLYPLLSRLKRNDLVEYNWQESLSGPPRKYYKLTQKGKKSLQELKNSWLALDKSISSLIKKHEKSS